MELNDSDDYERLLHEVQALIAQGRAKEALALAEACTGHPEYATPLQAVAYSSVQDDRDTLEKGIDLWRRLGPETSPEIAFQLASALQSVVDLTRAADGFVGVIDRTRHLMREARRLYLAAADSERADDRMRLVALVNCGNLYDTMGRDVDALRCYDGALEIDSEYGMALGNRGMALAKVAPFMGGHGSHVLEEAAWLLDRALEDEARVRETGGQHAIETFRDVRSSIVGDPPEAPDHGYGPQFEDSHLRWAYQHRLLLHISPVCLAHDATAVDPLHLGSMVWSIGEHEQARLKRLRDAFNAVKQEYLAARYSLWLATEPGSPIREHTQALSAQGYFADTLTYGRWGIQTGMAVQAMTAATNTLDKIAGLLHLYFGTDRKPKDISFYILWHAPRTKADKGKPLEVEPIFAEQLRTTRNEGLAAILDLSCEIEGNDSHTSLKKRIALRHAATHRYLVAHDLPMYEPDEAGWLERVDYGDIVEGTIEQLQVTRAALIYLARAIQARESSRKHDGETIPSLPAWEVEDFDTEP